MAASIVQKVRGQLNNNSVVNVTIAATSAGNTIVVTVAAYQNNVAATQITDNKGGGSSSYTLAPSTAVSGGNAGDSKTGIVCVQNCAAGITQVTYTVGAGSYGTIVVYELTGVTTTSLDKSTATGGQNTTTPSTGSTGTLSQADEIAIAVLADDCPGSAETITPAGGWTQDFEDETSNITANSEVSQVVSATTALNHQWTIQVARGAAASIATFKASAAAGVAVSGTPNVQSNTSSASDKTLTFASDTYATGDLIVVVALANFSNVTTQTLGTPSGGGNTFNSIAVVNANGRAAQAWWAAAVAGTYSITQTTPRTPGDSLSTRGVLYQLTGANTTSPVGATDTHNAASDPLVGNTNLQLTTASAGSLLFAAGTDWNANASQTLGFDSSLADTEDINVNESGTTATFAAFRTTSALSADDSDVRAEMNSVGTGDWAAIFFEIEKASAGGTNATVTPAVIATAATLPAVTEQTGWRAVPAEIDVAATMPASTAQGGAERAPAEIDAVVTIPAATAIAVDVPGAPTGLTPTPGDTQVALTWTAPASDGGSPITDYIVQYRVTP